MEENERKRPRVEEDEPSSSQQPTTGKVPPPYGSQAYWEERYRNQQEKKSDKDEPDAFHAWYFSYEELAPLILPLILGEGGEAEEEEEDHSAENETKGTNSNTDDGYVAKEKASSDDNEGDDEDVEEDGEEENEEDVEEEGYTEVEVEIDEESDEEEEVPKRVGLAQNGPITILEVGCGDVPLGRDIVKGIQDMESVVGVDASNILKKVVCVDYSPSVIESMKQDMERQNGNKTSVVLEYQIVDARKLPYDDESYDLLLEKGTLDAMLSDTKVGGDNCRLMVAECARVLSSGGFFVIISHLNAHVGSGLQWLDDVVVPGLRKGGRRFDWNVEVHGNSADIPSENEDDDGDSPPESPGPAVYIIQKVARRNDDVAGKLDDEKPRTIPLRFFSY